jgi:beta-phosphoglucomutase-like phosphatase (HAD superfamily)
MDPHMTEVQQPHTAKPPVTQAPEDSVQLSRATTSGESRSMFLEGLFLEDVSLNGTTSSPSRIRGHSRLDLAPPLISYISAPRDVYSIPRSVKALVIDFDGTTMKIKYTEGMRQTAFRRAILAATLEEHDLKLSDDEVKNCHRSAVHRPEEEMARIIAREIAENYGLLIDHARIFAKWLDECELQRSSHQERHRRPVQSAIVRGMEALIDAANARGIPVPVCTAGAHQFVEPLLQQSGLLEKLHGPASVYVNQHPHIRSKPHADPYLLVAERLGVQPSELLVLEDTATGALAALRAHARVLLQPSGDREQTIRTLLHHVRNEHPTWLEERPGAVTVLSRDMGWSQVQFPQAPREG